MPTKAHRPSGHGRTHSRSSSGSSKLGLNLQFTQQKDLPPPRLPDKGKKSALFHHESTARAASAQFMRSNSGLRVHSRDTIQPPALRRAPSPNTAAKQNGAKQKVDFTISSPGEGEDDDEWVSSESGAATPIHESDTETTPIEQVKQPLAQCKSTKDALHPRPNPPTAHDAPTPKATLTSLPRVDTARPSELPFAPTSRGFARPEQEAHFDVPSNAVRTDEHRPQLELQISSPTPPVNKARSETHSPPRRSPDIDLVHKRQSMTRPPSTHSVTSPVLRPHPLIRGLSSGPGAFASKPTPLAPLTTVLPEAASGEISNASSSPTSLRAASPTSIRTLSASPNPSPSSSSPAHLQLRRTSTSSVTSTATMPVLPSVSDKMINRSSHDRQRTMSTISSTSSLAALANLALRSTPSPPHAPHTITTHFPPQEQSAVLDAIHPLLPPPYIYAHLTLLRYRNLIRESYDRLTGEMGEVSM